MYSMKDLTVCDNKKIYVFDDLLSFEERYDYYMFCTTSLFKINGCDSYVSGNRNQLYSDFSEQDIVNMGFYGSKGFKTINDKLGIFSREILQIKVNCSTPFESNNVHLDKCDLTLLYYVNMKWELNWSGHTLFLNDDLENVEYCCLYKPGRIVIFDGSIPHMILLPNNQSEHHRLTFVIQYGSIQKEEK